MFVIYLQMEIYGEQNILGGKNFEANAIALEK